MSKLICTAGNNKGDEFLLTDGANIVGRAEDCDVVLFDKRASRRHCQLFQKGLHCNIEDLESTHGTLLNGKPIKKRRTMKIGDKIQIGATVLALCDDKAAGLVDRTIDDAAEALEEQKFDKLLDHAAADALKTKLKDKSADKSGGVGGFFRGLFGKK